MTAQPPYVGIACRTPNVTACGRVGIAVWAAGAQRVAVTIGGRTVRLRRRAAYWEAFVAVRGLDLPTRWYGTHPTRWLRFRLAVLRAGRLTRRIVVARLRPGYG